MSRDVDAWLGRFRRFRTPDLALEQRPTEVVGVTLSVAVGRRLVEALACG